MAAEGRAPMIELLMLILAALASIVLAKVLLALPAAVRALFTGRIG